MPVMLAKQGHRKRVRHYDEPGHFHELTFSCYRRMPLLTNDTWRAMLSVSIDRAVKGHDFRLIAFVLMPEHVHLLVLPGGPESRISGLLKAVKQPFSNRIKRLLVDNSSRLLQRLTVLERPGKTAFRFWQEGPGYDRNLITPEAVQASMNYIHMNPVRRGLVDEARLWRWSSCRWYVEEGQCRDRSIANGPGLSRRILG
jgi:putative transposase